MSDTERRASPFLLELVTDDGRRIQEPLLLVARVGYPSEDPAELNAYGIDTTHARFDGQQWTRCLLSEACADLLVKLASEEGFSYPLEAVPSRAALVWLEAARAGNRPPEQPLEDWLEPASIQALAHAVEAELLAEGWFRCANVDPHRKGGRHED